MTAQKSNAKGTWTIAESILHFQDGVSAVGPMIKVVDAKAFDACVQALQRAKKIVEKMDCECGFETDRETNIDEVCHRCQTLRELGLGEE